MASRIDHVVFIAGGVLVQALEDLVLDILGPGASLPNQARKESFELERRLTGGDISLEFYCRQMAVLACVDDKGETLNAATTVAERLAPTPDVAGVLAGLADKATLSLVSDYPRQWLSPAISRSSLDGVFDESNIFFLDEHKAPTAYPLFFAFLVKEGVLRPGSSLWIDYNSKRTSAALRQGIDAAVFVDAQRLNRELGHWSLVP